MGSRDTEDFEEDLNHDEGSIGVHVGQEPTFTLFKRMLGLQGLIFFIMLVVNWFYPLWFLVQVNFLAHLVPSSLGVVIEGLSEGPAAPASGFLLSALLLILIYLSLSPLFRMRNNIFGLGLASSELCLSGVSFFYFFLMPDHYFIFSFTGGIFAILGLVNLFLYLGAKHRFKREFHQ